MPKSNPAEWEFHIHTDSYAGNFERAMCAYITGMVGECGVGDFQAKKFYADMKLMDHLLEDLEPGADPWEGINIETFDADLDNPFTGYVVNKPDDRGCFRPVNLAVVDGEPNTVEIHFEKEPTDKHIAIMTERAIKWLTDDESVERFDSRPGKILGFSLHKRSVIMENVWNQRVD